MRVRQAVNGDSPRLVGLGNAPNVGDTADPSMPLNAYAVPSGEGAFPDLADVMSTFIRVGGDFLVVEHDGHLLGMGGYKPIAQGVEILRVRVHPAVRRQGVGRMLMKALETSARDADHRIIHLDTADNQPDAVTFYQGLGYTEVRRETQPEWTWTLVFFEKVLSDLQI